MALRTAADASDGWSGEFLYTRNAHQNRNRCCALDRAQQVDDGIHHDATLAAALDEADALRRALVQEHDARVRAESGRESGAATGAGPLTEENTR